MKQNLRFIFLTLLCAVFSSAWGQQVAYTFQTAKNGSYNDYTKTYDVVIDGLTWNVPGNHYDDGVLRIGGKSIDGVDRIITGKSPLSDEIISIKVNHGGTTSDKLIVNSFTVTVASDENFSNVIETETKPEIKKSTSGYFEISPPSNSNWPANSYYKFTINVSNSQSSNYAWVLNSIEFYKNGSADPVDPDVTLETTEVYVGRTLTISKPSDLTTTCSSQDESVVTVTNDGVITAEKEGTTSVTISWDASTKYNAGSETFNITVIPSPASTEYEKVTNNNQLVAGNEYLLVADGGTHGYYAMGKVESTSVRSAVSINPPSDQVISITDEAVVVITLGGEKNAWTLTTNDDLGDLCLTSDGNNIHYTTNKTNATPTQKTWTITNDFQVQNNYLTERLIKYNYNSGKPRMCCYSSNQTAVYLYVKKGSAVNNDPIITVTDKSIEVEANGEENGVITVQYEQFGEETAIDAEVAFYAADGETTATYDWITASINNDNNLTYTVSANTGEARTAYLKVVANNVYSDLITIAQAAYVVDYADIPFTFNDGSSEIANTSGLTQSGLGSDYSASAAPNTKLKFDNTDDYLILKLNPDEEHGVLSLSFDIKGNGNQGEFEGTFTVQTSADGDTYTDLHVFDGLEDAKTESATLEVESTVKYIKWIFTEKSTGNVGLGNIALIAPEEIAVTFAQAAEGYSTLYYGATTLKIPEGVKAYTYKVGDDGKAVETAYSTYIPKGSAVIVELDDKNKIANDNYIVNFTTAAGAGETAHADNMLYGFDEGGNITAGPNANKQYLFYSLSLNGTHDAGSIGFYWHEDEGAAFTMPAHKAYLAVEKTDTNQSVSSFSFDGMGTGIHDINVNSLPADGVYTLSGVRVDSDRLQKGIYIVNGKKVVIK